MTERISTTQEFVLEHCSVQYEETRALLKNNPEIGKDLLDPAEYSDDEWMEDPSVELELPMSEATKQHQAWSLVVSYNIALMVQATSAIDDAIAGKEQVTSLKELQTAMLWSKSLAKLTQCLYPTSHVVNALQTDLQEEVREILVKFDCMGFDEAVFRFADMTMKSTKMSELAGGASSFWQDTVVRCKNET